MSDTDALNDNVQKTKEDAANSFGQLKDDAVRVAKSAADIGRSSVEQVKSKIADGKEALQSKYSDGKAAVQSKITDGTEAVRTKISDGTEAAREYADRARERGNDLLGQVQKNIEQNPLQAVAIAAGVGVLVGVLLRRH